MAEIRQIAENLEVKKDGLSQLQDGSWVLKLKVNPDDMAVSLMKAAMGTRYIAALVEIGDDEQPVAKTAEKPKRNFADLPRSQQAALAGDREAFRKFAGETHYGAGRETINEIEAAAFIRLNCHVKSRAELDSDPEAAKLWDGLYADFQAWLNEPEP